MICSVNNRLVKVNYSSKNLPFLSLYRSHVIDQAFRPGLMKTAAKITNSNRFEFVPVSCHYPLNPRKRLLICVFHHAQACNIKPHVSITISNTDVSFILRETG